MPPTKQEFVETHYHLMMGLVVDAMVTQSRGAELSLRLKGMGERIERALAAAYDELRPPEPLAAVPAVATPPVQARPMAPQPARTPQNGRGGPT
jgi:hypothetical protein